MHFVCQRGKDHRETNVYYRDLECVLLEVAFSEVNVLSLQYSLKFSESRHVSYALKFYVSVVG